MKDAGTGKRAATLQKVLGAIGPYRGLLLLSIALALVSVAMTLYVPMQVGAAIDRIMGAGQVDLPGVLVILVRIAAVVAATAVCQWALHYANARMTYGVVRDMRARAFRKLQVLPLKYLDAQATGEVTSRVIADADQLADGLLMGFTQLFTGAVTILGTLYFMLRLHALVALVVILVTPLSFFVAKFIAGRTYDMFRLQSTTRGEQTALIDEMVGNQKVVQAFSQTDSVVARFDEVNGRLAEHSLRAIFFSSLTNPGTRFVNSVAYAGVALVGALIGAAGGLSVGALTAMLAYANQYTKPFNEISGVVTELQSALACAERIFALIEEPAEVPDAPDARPLADVEGRVALKDVSFAYRADQRLIEGMNLAVRPGQRVAIVGPTGCGKTTLINLLMRFYDVDAGTIEVEGRDIREIPRHSLRGSYGMVLQDTWLKAGTVRENLLLGRPQASEAEMIEAAKAAHAHSFIRRLPKGYDTELSEDGGSLSQGQRQLLCIARVMLSLPPMLILDEATSSIDTRTELKIQAAFARLTEGRTSFIVAHRLSTVQSADVILVMREGRIIEQGSHEQLLAENGFYAALYGSQFA